MKTIDIQHALTAQMTAVRKRLKDLDRITPADYAEAKKIDVRRESLNAQLRALKKRYIMLNNVNTEPVREEKRITVQEAANKDFPTNTEIRMFLDGIEIKEDGKVTKYEAPEVRNIRKAKTRTQEAIKKTNELLRSKWSTVEPELRREYAKIPEHWKGFCIITYNTINIKKTKERVMEAYGHLYPPSESEIYNYKQK